MTAPDSNTMLIFLGSLIASVIAWFTGYARGLRKSGVRDWQHGKMWAQYEKDHGINGNGKQEA